jgi:hypothetical protein
MGLFYLTFAAAGALTGWVGGQYVAADVTEFWALHAVFAIVAAVGLILLKRHSHRFELSTD